MYTMGIDIGTTTICGVIYDTVNESVSKSVMKQNGSFLETEKAWQKHQDPKKIVATVYEVIEELMAEYPEISVVGLTGQMHGIVYTDKDGEAISQLYIWQDGSGNEPYNEEMTYSEYLTATVGYPMASGYGLVTHAYNQKNGLVPEQAAHICTIHDYIGMKLTGRKTPLVHASDAASFGAYDLIANKFDVDALTRAGIDTSVLPEVTDDCSLVGEFRGIPVVAAIGDNQASFLGAVRDPEHSLLVNIGTGSQVSVMTTKPCATANTEARPFLKGSYLSVGSSLCGGRAYAALEQFFRAYAIALGAEDKAQYKLMDQLSEAVYTMSKEEKLAVTTKFNGTRKSPEIRGSIANIGLDNLTPTHLVVGFLEGTVEELHEMYAEIECNLEAKPTLLVGSGNGIRKSKVWQNIASERFALPLTLSPFPEEASTGAAIFAAKYLA